MFPIAVSLDPKPCSCRVSRLPGRHLKKFKERNHVDCDESRPGVTDIILSEYGHFWVAGDRPPPSHRTSAPQHLITAKTFGERSRKRPSPRLLASVLCALYLRPTHSRARDKPIPKVLGGPFIPRTGMLTARMQPGVSFGDMGRLIFVGDSTVSELETEIMRPSRGRRGDLEADA